jgi:hypothetical protein
MTQLDIEILREYVNIYDLEADVAPKKIEDWENQIILMWTLADARNQLRTLKSVIDKLVKEDFFRLIYLIICTLMLTVIY